MFVDNLDRSIDDNKLSANFKKFGRIMTSKLVMDERSRSKRCGFVAFFDAEAADEAVKSNGTLWRKRKIAIKHFDLKHRKVCLSYYRIPPFKAAGQYR